ncbi:MAG: lysophospholipid acyltransferase family protein [Vicinamibacterales bacterium]|nr:lysophospholipid acyltransferase family protein [Vicinamibacterales bacterium]
MPREPASRLGRVARHTRYLAEAGVFDVLSVLARHASPQVRHALASALGTTMWTLDVRHRRVAMANLKLAYGESLPPGDARRIVLASMRHFAHLAVETLAFERYLAEAVESRVRVEGLEHLRNAYARGTGVIGFTGHLGHWELLAFMFGRLGMPATGIARPLDNPYLEQRLMRLRTLSGNRVINKRGAFKEALGILLGGGFVGIWIDQRPKRGGIVVPFFGADAYTTDGLARLVLASGAALTPAFVVREDDGSFCMTIEPEVPVERTGDPEADARRITADCTAVIERWVRRYPAQWLWTHRRWAVPKQAAERRAGAGVTSAP